LNDEVADEVVDEVVEQGDEPNDEPVQDINWLDVWESFLTQPQHHHLLLQTRGHRVVVDFAEGMGLN
jgi:hypothetical protein